MTDMAWAIISEHQVVFLWTIKRTRTEAIRAFFRGVGEKFETDADLLRAWRRRKHTAQRVRIEVMED